ncbi:Bug family tripartite tricarboxylate transporter substrate binding protein [Halohasta litorea]|uniref:Bug family tripartite tricarboxylate transporter substrate binding protein n=1 Tax=Halohasta litorea TaxID=869891 RepID=A0ABD6DDM0_9EURY|nr:tripartite tricarboxylate transporter substrate-binding protein [Halohasta litorea]
MTGTNRRQFIKLTGAGIGASTLAGCLGGDDGDGGNGGGGGGGDDYPPSSLTFVNAYSEGGGVDTNFRQIQGYFEEYLGANLSPEYRAGAGTRTAATTVAQDEEVMRIGGTLSPATPAAIAVDEVEGTEPQYTLDDLQPLGTLSGEAAIIRVREDEDRFTTIQELVDYSVDNSVTVGASGPTNRNVLSIIQLMEATEADFTIVPYDGGGATQTALLQGEIDVAARSVYNSASIAEDSHCLCIYAEENPEPGLTNDAPPINDELGTDINYAPSNGTQFYYVSAAAAEAYPDRFEHVQQAFKDAHEDEDYRADLSEIDEEGKLVWNSPEETDAILQSAYETYRDFAPLFDEYVQS